MSIDADTMAAMAAVEPSPEQAAQIAMSALAKLISIFVSDINKVDPDGLKPAVIEYGSSFLAKDRSLQARLMYNRETKLFQVALSRLEWPVKNGKPVFIYNGQPLKPKHKSPPFILYTRGNDPQVVMQFVGLEKDNVPGCSYDCDRKGWVDDESLAEFEDKSTKAAVAKENAKNMAVMPMKPVEPPIEESPVASVAPAKAELLAVAEAASVSLDSKVEPIDDDDDVDDKVVVPSTP